MSKSVKSILLWDISACPANSTECISNLVKLLKVNFTSIIVTAAQHSDFPPDISDLSTLMPIVLRYGKHAIYDAIVDAVSSIGKSKKFNFVLLSNSYGIWIDLFQKLPPTSLVFVSKNDPRQSLSYSFLPESVKSTILQYPSLNEITGQVSIIDSIMAEGNDDEDDNLYQPIIKKHGQKPQKPYQNRKGSLEAGGEEEEEENYEQNDSYSPKKESQKVVFKTKTSPPSQVDRIKPLSNLEKHQIDLRSPTPSKAEKADGRNKNSASKDQGTSFPLMFQPLIEAMKSIGKSMISKSDLEEQFNICCKNLNLPPQDLMLMIEKASSYGLIIYDNSINYVRFKNRSLATATITYI
ncbi:hypothetical protein TRFO_00869 [Tritrichomonas foetus]|uniref:NYN domain-containing protein n=1 Tax=Tritrichomonas foetus TaxID=1144522 RepID=A0A1J4L2D6_9EUKA|nr:hypothetical protein TRFO_00869 [Tritrichomonas foetus]|eukprot:OHT17611.1 hypothetical protein TRFO_00869 [Tritrichomonas foetus]